MSLFNKYKENNSMKKLSKPFIPLYIISLLAIGIFIFSCKFSFADNKKPQKDSITFGAEKKPTIKKPADFESFRSVFSDIAKEVIPTVVSVTSTKIDTIIYRDPFYQFFYNNPFEEFFGSPRRKQQQPDRQEERRTSGVGSGVIVSKDGYILTNYHVVGEADEITIETHDERQFEAEIVGVDSLSDVAVIKIKENVNDLPVAYLGNSDKLRPGDWVMAIGNPFNLSSTVTNGIVSALGRHQNGISMYQNFIQTDAAINPGNSGGALVNIEGELIGINTMIYTRSGGYMGIGFAIPINMARRIMEQLIYKGEVSRGWLGVQISDIDHAMKEALGLKTTKGVLINDVFDGQPAKKAGIKTGDVILTIDGIETKDANSLRNTVASITPGKKVPVEIIRNGKKKELHVTLASRDEKEIKKLSSKDEEEEDKKPAEVDVTKKVGFKVGNITKELRDRLGLKSNAKGIVVIDISPSSWAARKGLRKYDIIKKVKVKSNDFVVVNDAKVFKKIISRTKSEDSILLYVEREGNSFFIAFKVE